MIAKIWSFILKNIGQGLLLIVPISITGYFLYWLYGNLNSYILKLQFFDIPIIQEGGALDLNKPGMGIGLVVLFVILIGLLGSKLFKLPIFNYFSGVIKRAPLIGIIYSSIKDLLEAFVGNKKKFTEPVLLKLSKESDIEQMGFITQRDLSLFGISQGKISVYIPFPYSFMGNLYIVPTENITLLDISPTQAMKFIVSGGVSANEMDDDQEDILDSK